ncbi:MAG: phosphoribosyl-AMP cyclohydrolase [Candidatus Bathyarchaeota archaeon]
MEKLSNIKISSLNFDERTGLIPVITQEIGNREVLMLAYANKEAVEKTLVTGFAHYWSRSRRALWMKGETSGNTQRIKQILVDCDYDALLYLVEQKGNACHMDKKTCFHNNLQ